ncbi:BRCA1-A complex subunit Abraxas 1 [Cololabis saira]|uniref:BRCA1-A complex subunit Abraxas 1 n=1 Tax=Cololabis saira TaxID=129043 RepID=UPI002AD37CFE|nr:BRCA1-A complex subunit Abraxas 1 [Cololabis saira]
MSEPTVRVSGIVLSSLMLQHANSDADVEGLLLGESRFDEQVTITDSQSDHIHIEETHNVQKHIACHRLNTLYSCSGDVNMQVLQEMLGNNKQDSVIGWYRQRRNTEQCMTFREKLVQENLRRDLVNPHLIFLLLTPSRTTSAGSTHQIEYSAFISDVRRFKKLPVLINNLGLLEQPAYWKTSASGSAAGYLSMKNHRSNPTSPNSLLKEVNNMNKSLQAKLEKLCRGVEESEREVETLQAEVSALRKRREQRRMARKASDAPMPPEPRNNPRLMEAIRALLGDAPLLLTQTLDLQSCPIPDPHVSMETQGNLDTAREQPPLMDTSIST